MITNLNVFIESVPATSRYHTIFRALLDAKFELAVSTEILLEYEEIMANKLGDTERKLFARFIEYFSNVVFVSPTYRFNLIIADPDDNKFVDCAICANAIAIVTSDSHFKVLKNIEFPKVTVWSPSEFMKQLL